MGEPNKREPMKWTDIAIVILTAGILAAAGLQTYIFHRQRKEMTDSGKQTDRIIADDERLAAANERFAGAMEQTVKDNKTALDKTIKENKKALAATLAQGQKALDSTIKNARLDERPWITISAFQMSGEPEDKKEFTIRCAITNSGKTPALNMVPQSIIFLNPIAPPMTKFPEPQTAESRSIVAPGPTTMNFMTKPWVIEQTYISQYTKKDLTLYLHALIRYSDTFGTNHWTSVCAIHTYGAPLNEFQYCEQGNEIDKEGGPSSGILPN
jgi:hypothetical protein